MNDLFVEELADRPFEPIVETSPYLPPKATIDPDKSKSWVGRAWPIVRTHRRIWFLSLGMSFIALVTQVQIPRVLGDGHLAGVAGRGAQSPQSPSKALSSIALLALGLILLRQITNYIGRRCLLTVAYRFEYDLRNIIYDHYMGLSFPFYDRVAVGQLISRANSDVRAVQMYLVMAPTILVQCSVVLVAFAEMSYINVPLTLIIATQPRRRPSSPASVCASRCTPSPG